MAVHGIKQLAIYDYTDGEKTNNNLVCKYYKE